MQPDFGSRFDSEEWKAQVQRFQEGAKVFRSSSCQSNTYCDFKGEPGVDLD
jgi:hypothetical protein